MGGTMVALVTRNFIPLLRTIMTTMIDVFIRHSFYHAIWQYLSWSVCSTHLTMYTCVSGPAVAAGFQQLVVGFTQAVKLFDET